MVGKLRDQVTKLQLMLAAGVAICYGVGYPLGLIANSVVGWFLVTLGGFFLVALGTVIVRRIHQGSASGRTDAGSIPDPSPRAPSAE